MFAAVTVAPKSPLSTLCLAGASGSRAPKNIARVFTYICKGQYPEQYVPFHCRLPGIYHRCSHALRTLPGIVGR